MSQWAEGDALTPTNLNTKSGLLLDVRSYGGLGLGSASSVVDTAAVKAAEAARVAAGGGILYFPPGSYWLTPSTASSLVTIGAAGKWLGAGLSLTTFVYAGGASLDTGSDFSVASGQTTSRPAGLGVLNILSNGVSLDNFAIDGRALAQYAVCWQQALVNGHLNISVFSTKDKSFGGTYATWSGLNYCASADIPGQSLSGSSLTQGLLARGIGGNLFRTDCPIQDGSDSVISHAPVAALVLGNSTPIGEGAGGNSRTFCTGGALAFTYGGYNMIVARLDSVGLISGPLDPAVANDTNYYTADIYLHDLANVVQETYGTGYSPSYGFGSALPSSGESVSMGHILKQGAISAWYHYNVVGSDATRPNVWISGGSSLNSGRVFANAVKVGSVDDVILLSANTATPSIKWGTNFRTTNTSLTTFTNFLSGHTGEDIKIFVNDSNTAIDDGPNIVLGLGHALKAYNGQVFDFFYQGAGVWRCTNGPNGPLSANSSNGDFAFPQASYFSVGAALRPAVAFSSESSLGFFSSAASTVALSYGTFNLRGAILSSIRSTDASATSATLNDGEFRVAAISVTSAELAYRSGNTTYRFIAAATAV